MLAGGGSFGAVQVGMLRELNISWQNYERSWSLWKARALAKLEADRRR